MDPPSSSTKRPRGRPRKPLLAVSEATPRARPRDTDDKTASPQPRPQPVDATPTSHVVQTDGHAVDDVVDDVDADAAVTPVATRLPMAVVGDDAADATVTTAPVDGGDGSAVADASADAVDADDDQLLVDAEQMRGRSEEAMQHMRLLLEAMSPDQQRRFETQRSAAFPRAAIRKLVQQALGSGQQVPDKMAVVVGGVAKMFVGELVEAARDVQEERGDTGAITPEHLREANRRMRATGAIPSARHKPRLFL